MALSNAAHLGVNESERTEINFLLTTNYACHVIKTHAKLKHTIDVPTVSDIIADSIWDVNIPDCFKYYHIS